MKIYILKCVKNKYYVGKTVKNIEIRYKEHLKGYGASWTKIYKPLNIIESIDNIDNFDEDKYTKIYMNKYGIDNVRGGSYSNIILEDYQLKALNKELLTANNKCFNCGETTHYISNCPYLKKIKYVE